MTSNAARVLVADDSESTRYVIATWLRRAGMDVVEAATGEEALRIAATERLDLVVLDVNLPDMTGYDVCERIKAGPRSSSTPVLHVSATATDSTDRSEGLRRGADGYLVEPVERDELVATVEALLRGSAAHRTALRLARRLRRLNEATFAVNESAELHDLVITIATQAATLFESTAIVTIAGDEGRSLTARARRGEDPVVTAGPAQAVETLAQIAREAVRVDASVLTEIAPLDGEQSFLSASLDGGAGLPGFLLVEAPHDVDVERDDETDVVLLQYARAAANAIKNVRSLDVERQIALTLQRSLLPVVPPIAGIDVAVRYEASAEHSEVGGDFYEIFPLDEDRVAFAIGDVVGHSLDAATVMAELRTGIRSYILEGHGPTETIQRLDRLLARFHPGVTATVCCAILDLRSGMCELANAGHPPALLSSGEDVAFLPVGGTLLGVDAPPAAPHVFALLPDDVLVLYTDGLVERRGEDIDIGLARLAAAVRGRDGDLNDLCEHLLRAAGPPSRTDDIALVAIRINDRP
ncbi:MAG TPA: SpoIIE family protein phosphatase [Candidatus Elarobacter sp.]|nr:SpoIIE family protein phosphatase [Candidatus Elarobacter sp.]